MTGPTVTATVSAAIGTWNETMRCVGRIVLVTGGDSGIGAITGVARAQEGADVELTYLRDAEDAAATAHAVAALFARVEAEFGPPDVPVNNAGAGQGGTPLADMSNGDGDRLIRAARIALSARVLDARIGTG